jgi:hypothetical protein
MILLSTGDKPKRKNDDVKKTLTPYQRNPLDELPRFTWAGCIPPQDEPRGLSLRNLLLLSALALATGWYGMGYLLSIAQ